MADRISKEKRSWNMSRIRGKDTTPEKKVRSHLFKNGFRFRKNVKELCGKPDIVLHKYKTVIFINSLASKASFNWLIKFSEIPDLPIWKIAEILLASDFK